MFPLKQIIRLGNKFMRLLFTNSTAEKSNRKAGRQILARIGSNLTAAIEIV